MTVTWFTGNSGSGKTTRAKKLVEQMKRDGVAVAFLDGDDMREVWPGLGFDELSRTTQNLRVARLAKLLDIQGINVVVATICPYQELRAQCKRITGCTFIYVPGGKTGHDYPYEADGSGI